MFEKSQIKNIELWKQFKFFSEKGFYLLNKHKRDLPYKTRKCIKTGHFIGYIPSFEGLIHQYKNELTNLKEFHSCMDAINRDSTINNDIEKKDFLVEFLIKLARQNEYCEISITNFFDELEKRRNDLFKFRIEEFNKIYGIFEKYLYSNRQYFALSPLIGFELETDELDFGNYLKIKRMSNGELIELWYDHYSLLESIDSMDFMNIRFCIVAELKTQAYNESDFDSIIASLRLWKKGRIGKNKIYVMSKWNPQGGMIARTLETLHGGNYLVLKSSEVSEFKEFFVKVNNLKISQYSYLKIAINRFNYAFEKGRQVDKLIDYVMSFEALFSEGAEDLSYKIPLRVARLLEVDFVQRKRIYKILRRAYSTRSVIVHGEETVGKINVIFDENNREKYSFHDFNLIIEEYLRRSIKEFIMLIMDGKDKNKILEEIDFC